MSPNQVSAGHHHSQNPSSLDAVEDQCRVSHHLTERGVGESSNSLDTLGGGPDQQLSIPSNGRAVFRQSRASLQSLTGSSSSSIGVERELQSLSSSSLSGSSSASDSEDEDKRSASKGNTVNQSELRKQILKIQSDTTIPASDKAKRIQVLVMS